MKDIQKERTSGFRMAQGELLGFVLLVGGLFSLPQEEAFLGDTSL